MHKISRLPFLSFPFTISRGSEANERSGPSSVFDDKEDPPFKAVRASKRAVRMTRSERQWIWSVKTAPSFYAFFLRHQNDLFCLLVSFFSTPCQTTHARMFFHLTPILTPNIASSSIQRSTTWKRQAIQRAHFYDWTRERSWKGWEKKMGRKMQISYSQIPLAITVSGRVIEPLSKLCYLLNLIWMSGSGRRSNLDLIFQLLA